MWSNKIKVKTMFSNLEILLNNKWYAGNKNIICKIKSKHLGMSLSVTTKITYVILRKMVDPKRLSNCINCRHSILKYNILSCLGLLSENSWAFTYRTHLANLLVITLWKIFDIKFLLAMNVGNLPHIPENITDFLYHLLQDNSNFMPKIWFLPTKHTRNEVGITTLIFCIPLREIVRVLL